MEDIYPGMSLSYQRPIATLAEFYIYGSAFIGIMAALTLICIKEPTRMYRITKRKNTDENPVINV